MAGKFLRQPRANAAPTVGDDGRVAFYLAHLIQTDCSTQLVTGRGAAADSLSFGMTLSANRFICS
jgi:hypothetical protein